MPTFALPVSSISAIDAYLKALSAFISGKSCPGRGLTGPVGCKAVGES